MSQGKQLPAAVLTIAGCDHNVLPLAAESNGRPATQSQAKKLKDLAEGKSTAQSALATTCDLEEAGPEGYRGSETPNFPWAATYRRSTRRRDNGMSERLPGRLVGPLADEPQPVSDYALAGRNEDRDASFPESSR